MKTGDLVKFIDVHGDEWSPIVSGKIGLVIRVRPNVHTIRPDSIEWDAVIEGQVITGFTTQPDESRLLEIIDETR